MRKGQEKIRETVLILGLSIAFGGALLLFGQDRRSHPAVMAPPDPVPPVAVLVHCNERVMTAAEMPQAAEAMLAAGCRDIQFRYTVDGWWHGIGTRLDVAF